MIEMQKSARTYRCRVSSLCLIILLSKFTIGQVYFQAINPDSLSRLKETISALTSLSVVEVSVDSIYGYSFMCDKSRIYMEAPTTKGKWNGLVNFYSDNGRPIRISYFTAGMEQGVSINYYQFGGIESQGDLVSYSLDSLATISTTEFPNQNTGETIISEVVSDYQTLKNGLWRYFDYRGLLVKEEFFERGILIFATKF